MKFYILTILLFLSVQISFAQKLSPKIKKQFAEKFDSLRISNDHFRAMSLNFLIYREFYGNSALMKVRSKEELDSIYHHLADFEDVLDIVIVGLPFGGTEGATWQEIYQYHFGFTKSEAKKIVDYHDKIVLKFQRRLFYNGWTMRKFEDKKVLNILTPNID